MLMIITADFGQNNKYCTLITWMYKLFSWYYFTQWGRNGPL